MKITSKRLEVYITDDGINLIGQSPNNLFSLNSKGDLESVESLNMLINKENAKILSEALLKYFEYLETGILPEEID